MIRFCGRQTCNLLTNGMTEFTPVVAVVDFYWSDPMIECPFSLYGRVFCLAAWDSAVSDSVEVSDQTKDRSWYPLHPKPSP